MRFRRPASTEVGATPGDPRPTNPPASTPVLLVPAAVDADWSVPSGVRKASEWAWRGLVIAAALVAVLYLISLLSEIVIPLLMALLLAALLQPAFRWLARFMPRGAAAGLTVVGTLVFVFGLLSFVGSQLTSQLDDMTTKVADGIDQIRRWLNSTFGITDTQLEGYIDRAREWLSSQNLADTATSAGLTATHILAGFFLALFALFFFLYDGATIWRWVTQLFPRGARARVRSSGDIAWVQLSSFTRATLLVAASDAIGIGVGAAILGVPFASGITLLVFFGAFIPVVGAAVSGTVAVMLALVALGPVQALIMLAIVIGVQQFESHVLQPFLVGRVMRLHPLAILLAIAAGIVLAGIVGGLIAVPVVAVLNAVGHHLLDEEDGESEHVGAAAADEAHVLSSSEAERAEQAVDATDLAEQGE
ncbi:AI-2E family transporter [Ornithinibacter aureus]|uniref:AI-2E family transporter n=1 Tax=Ornithinibacter aureus TaxID=622664 RepID=A0ABP8JL89_9MICO|nr:AI-2E family transporter [Ornithinibacter aureus]KAF0835085.1 putative PurR-regulated permease PerM [Ornithinibacter aureus]